VKCLALRRRIFLPGVFSSVCHISGPKMCIERGTFSPRSFQQCVTHFWPENVY
jgi:hypothetical protein